MASTKPFLLILIVCLPTKKTASVTLAWGASQNPKNFHPTQPQGSLFTIEGNGHALQHQQDQRAAFFCWMTLVSWWMKLEGS
jgi:hypothetical protein